MSNLFKSAWISHLEDYSTYISENIYKGEETDICSQNTYLQQFNDFVIVRVFWRLYIKYIFINYDLPNMKQNKLFGEKKLQFPKYALIAIKHLSFDKVTN